MKVSKTINHLRVNLIMGRIVSVVIQANYNLGERKWKTFDVCARLTVSTGKLVRTVEFIVPIFECSK